MQSTFPHPKVLKEMELVLVPKEAKSDLDEPLGHHGRHLNRLLVFGACGNSVLRNIFFQDGGQVPPNHWITSSCSFT